MTAVANPAHRAVGSLTLTRGGCIPVGCEGTVPRLAGEATNTAGHMEHILGSLRWTASGNPRDFGVAAGHRPVNTINEPENAPDEIVTRAQTISNTSKTTFLLCGRGDDNHGLHRRGPPSLPVASSGAIPELEPTINLTPPPTATTKPSLQELPAAERTPGGTATRVPTPAQISSAELYELTAPSIPAVRSSTGKGSGILIEGNYVLTNMHVVWPDRTVRLTFPDGTRLDRVPVVGVEPMADLALLGPVSSKGTPYNSTRPRTYRSAPTSS